MSRAVRRLIPVSALAATLALACAATSAHAVWTPGGVQLSSAPLVQNEPITVSDGVGGAYVMWNDLRSGTSDLYAQHVLADGTIAPGWPTDGLAVCDLPGVPSGAVLVSDGQGGAYASWADSRAGTPDIYALRLVSGGKAPGWPDDGLLVCNAASAQNAPSIAPDGTGGALVAWTDVRGATSDIYAMRLLGSGTVDPTWTANGNIVCNAARTQNAPALCTDGVGGAVIAWVDGRNGTTLAPDWDVYALRISGAGVADPAWTANGEAVCLHGTSDQTNVVAFQDGASGAYLAWTDGRNGPRASQVQDLFGVRLDGLGDVAAGWTANGQVITQAPGNQTSALLASDGAGGLFVAWADGRDTTTFPTNVDVYAARFTDAGALAPGWTVNGTNLTPISPTRQEDPSIAPDLANGLYVAWEDGRNGGHVFLLRVAGNGAIAAGWPAGGIELSATTGTQLNTSLAPDGAGGVLMAWDDPRPSASDKSVFAQRIGPNGQIGPTVGIAPGSDALGIRLALRGAHPVVGRAQFSLETDEATHYTAAIYGPAGRRVWSAGADARAGAGEAQTLTWGGRDDQGRRVPPGVYWVRVAAGSKSAAMRFVFLP